MKTQAESDFTDATYDVHLEDVSPLARRLGGGWQAPKR